MPAFSSASERHLKGCRLLLQQLFHEVVKHRDCTIICGHRPEDDQEEAVRTGHSQVHWPDGNHNAVPSNAADVAPYPLDWEDRERFTYFAGYVMGVAEQMGIPLRWGGDWDNDGQVKDNRFDDLVHFELVL